MNVLPLYNCINVYRMAHAIVAVLQSHRVSYTHESVVKFMNDFRDIFLRLFITKPENTDPMKATPGNEPAEQVVTVSDATIPSNTF